jgi:hypothetical protein
MRFAGRVEGGNRTRVTFPPSACLTDASTAEGRLSPLARYETLDGRNGGQGSGLRAGTRLLAQPLQTSTTQEEWR